MIVDICKLVYPSYYVELDLTLFAGNNPIKVIRPGQEKYPLFMQRKIASDGQNFAPNLQGIVPPSGVERGEGISTKR